MSPPSMHSELCFGLVLLLEAAEYQNKVHMVTPLCNRKRDHTSMFSPSPTKPVYSKPVASLPPKKRIKFYFNRSRGPLWLGTNHCTASNTIKFSPLKKSTKCTGGSTHRVWEPTDQTAASARRFPWNVGKATEEKGTKVAASGGDKTFTLYHKDDDKHINPVHSLIRRDIWEGFVLDISKDVLDEDASARRTGRLARYDGTVGLRCRFCKHVPRAQRAEKDAVYPRSLERIYLANIRFQRDHIK